jgi:hypothetical protein
MDFDFRPAIWAVFIAGAASALAGVFLLWPLVRWLAGLISGG